MKKIYLVEVEECDYDQYDAMVVVADNEEQAIEMCKTEDYDTYKYSMGTGFVKSQGKITAKEVDLSTDGIVLSSFNAG